MRPDGDVNYHIDGIGLSYGSPVVWWLRSPCVDGTVNVYCVNSNGYVYYGYWYVDDSYGPLSEHQ